MLLTNIILHITRSAPDERDGCQLLLIPKDNGPWIDCSRKGSNLEITCNDMAGAAIGLDVLLTKGHCGPTVQKLSVSLGRSYNETDSSNASRITEATKKDFQRCLEHYIQKGLTSLMLTVKSIKQEAGIFPSNMDTVDLKICFLEKPIEGELRDWVSSFSSVSVKSLTLGACLLYSTVDLEDLFCVLCQNANILHIKTTLDIQHGRVSAERALELFLRDLSYEVRIGFMEVCGIEKFSTLKGLLTSKCLWRCTLKVEPGFPDSLTEEECREVLEMEEVRHCLSASPSVCDLLTSLLSRVTVCSKPLYGPCLKRVEDVEYVASNILPILQRKSEPPPNGIELRVDIGDEDLKKKMLEFIQTTGIFHYEPDKTSMQPFRYHVFNR